MSDPLWVCSQRRLGLDSSICYHCLIVILKIFAGHLFDRIKYFASEKEILLVLTDRRALFAKTELDRSRIRDSAF